MLKFLALVNCEVIAGKFYKLAGQDRIIKYLVEERGKEFSIVFAGLVHLSESSAVASYFLRACLKNY